MLIVNIVPFADLPCTSTCRTLWPDCSTPESGSLTPHSHHTRCRPSRQVSGNTCHLYQAPSYDQYNVQVISQCPHIKLGVWLVFSHIFICSPTIPTPFEFLSERLHKQSNLLHCSLINWKIKIWYGQHFPPKLCQVNNQVMPSLQYCI